MFEESKSNVLAPGLGGYFYLLERVLSTCVSGSPWCWLRVSILGHVSDDWGIGSSQDSSHFCVYMALHRGGPWKYTFTSACSQPSEVSMPYRKSKVTSVPALLVLIYLPPSWKLLPLVLMLMLLWTSLLLACSLPKEWSHELLLGQEGRNNLGSSRNRSLGTQGQILFPLWKGLSMKKGLCLNKQLPYILIWRQEGGKESLPDWKKRSR